MPLSYQRNINEATKIGVWHITEAEDFFSGKVSVQRSITHPHKRLQHLAGRYLLQELFPEFPMELIQIADTRKPFLADEAFHFSISHCGDYAAVIVSKTNRVGVDIEIPDPKVDRIRHKFLSEKEQQLLNSFNAGEHLLLTMAWSIKEAIFKWYGDGAVDFIGHMHINALQRNEDEVAAECSFTKNAVQQINVHSIVIANNNLSWIVT